MQTQQERQLVEQRADLARHQRALPAAAERRRFVTIAECAGIRPFSPQALRDMKHKAFDRKNDRGEDILGNGTGPAGVWIQIGVKVLVDLDALDRWIEGHRITGNDS